jgi:DNA-binding CsgD family transcriptional regulator/tetratricopeptide (TPR) repeat protein
VLLVLEDLHWADTSTLDLVVYLAHNVGDRPILLIATYREDEPPSAERMRRLADGVRRSGAGLLVELGALEDGEVATLVAAHAETPLSAALTQAIVGRSEGNPFFAEELLAAAGDESAELPRHLRDLLLQRIAQLDRPTQSLMRVASAAGRDVSYRLFALAGLPESDVRESLGEAVRRHVLVADQPTGTFRFRHALLAEAIYATILPGEREELHARLAEELARAGEAKAAELAPHWAAAGRNTEALTASVEAAREAQAVFAPAEAFAHLERALALWDVVPDAAQLAGLDLAELCSWAAELASQTGRAPRAVELGQQAIELVGESDRLRASLLHQYLGRYLFENGSGDTFLAVYERALELTPTDPPSAERARALAALGTALLIVWRHEESLAVCENALEVARRIDARPELHALIALGSDLAYLGRADEGLARLRDALGLAEATGNPQGLYSAYVALTDVLTMLGRPRESAALGEAGLEVVRRYGIDHTVLAANRIEALLAIGEWDDAERASTEALRSITANYPHMPFGLRADLELGRGDFDAARAHLEAARPTIRHEPGLATYAGYVAELALWERRWTDADDAVRDGVKWARPRWGAQIRVWLCAKGLRAQAELAALARARREGQELRQRLGHAGSLLTDARAAAAEASAITPNAEGWLALAEAEHERAGDETRPETWSDAATTWERLERPPLAAYCRWREAEALVAAGRSRPEASAPLRAAYATADRIGAKPLLGEIELLAQRARLDLAPATSRPSEQPDSLEETLGLTPREAEVLTLVARGYTNREIAATLVISVKTAGVHVSHILSKLGAANRLEAAAIAHRVLPAERRATS